MKRHVLCGHRPTFGQSTKNLGPFLPQALLDVVLRWRANDGFKGTCHPMHHGQIFEHKDTLEECKMNKVHVQAVVGSLNKEFMIYLFSTHQNFVVQGIILVMKKFV